MYFLGIVWNPNDTIFALGPLQIKYYNMLWIAAFILGFYLMKKIFLNENKPLEKLDSLFMYCVISIMLGARLGHVFFYDWQDHYKDHLIEILLPIKEKAGSTLFGIINGYEFSGFAGLASHGAAIAGIIGLWLFARKNKDMSMLWLLDRIAITAAIGGAFVRLGNFFNSEINGKMVEKTAFMATKFIRDSDDMPAYRALQITKEKTVNAAYKALENKAEFASYLEAIPYRYPVQLFEAMGYLLVFAILFFFIYKKTNLKKKEGFMFGLWLATMMGVIRFSMEFFKKSQGGFEETWGTFSTGQWLSIPFFILGLYLMFRPQKTA